MVLAVSRRDRIRTGLRVAGLPALWVLTAWAMVGDALRDPFVAARQGTAAYGHNHEGALLQVLPVTLIELGVVMLILRPWSYRRSWGRSVAALVVFLPWTLLSAAILMHQGGVVVLHAMWLASLVVVLVACVAWSGVAALRARRR